MNRAWGLGLVILVGCGAPASAQGPASTSAAETPITDRTQATKTPVAGASNPHECEDAPPSEPKLIPTSLVGDETLAGLDACTKMLKEPGELGIALVFSQKSRSPSVYVTESTVHECRVVGCVKDHLAQLRAPTTHRAMQHVDLALVPRERVKRVKNVAWPLEKNQFCTDAADELGEFRTGRLPPEQIQSVVRVRYPEFRKCYEIGLASNAQLSGRVAIRFAIERDGHVSNSYIQDNDIPDCRVAQCVRDQMTRNVFPRPEKGVVKVLYPIQFSPG